MTETKRKLDLCYGIITEYLVDKGFKKKGLLYTKKDAQFCITFKIDKVLKTWEKSVYCANR